MTELLLYRSFAPVALTDDGRTIVGLAAPYGEVAMTDDGAGPYRETFDRGAFAHVVEKWPARRCKVQLEHPERIGMGAWVGRGQEWRDEADGLHVVLRLDDTKDGRAAAFKVRDGQTPAMSIAFAPGQSEPRWHADLGAEVIHRRSVRAIGHVALVPQGTYRLAQVEALRSTDLLTVDGGRSTVDGLSGPPAATLSATPRRDQLAEWLATMRTDSPPAAGTPSPP